MQTHVFGINIQTHIVSTTHQMNYNINQINASPLLDLCQFHISTHSMFRCSALWEAIRTHKRNERTNGKKYNSNDFFLSFTIFFLSVPSDIWLTFLLCSRWVCVCVCVCFDLFRLILSIFIFRRRIQWMFNTWIYFCGFFSSFFLSSLFCCVFFSRLCLMSNRIECWTCLACASE